ncbi:MAG: lipopolysaccharide biosynthesis protein, partial [Clostridia bacterium]|nr:lipopolysaccharide biosynthesis protein [Clostridia bacterium]
MEPSIVQGFFWKLLERFGVQTASFILSIILARLLSPNMYGVLALMMIFTTFANIFVQSGLNTALIQDRTVTEEDYSSVFWLSLIIAIILYLVLFSSAPLIANVFGMPNLTTPFRWLALILIPGAFNSVQLAKVSKNLDFKNVFKSNILATIISGMIGIILAYLGAELWSLVLKEIVNACLICLVMWFTVKWRPKFLFDPIRIKKLFSFGWKILLTTLIDNIYTDLRSLVVGKKFSAETLGFYDRGKQFPRFVINGINGAVQSVMLPAFSMKQDCKSDAKAMLNKSIVFTCFFLFPSMAILAGSGKSLILILLTEKWLNALPYMQIYCFTFAFWPIHTCNLQFINSVGRSDLFLKLEIIKKTISLALLIFAVIYFSSPLVIAMVGAISSIIDCFINAQPNRKLIGYPYERQMLDILPYLLISIAVFFLVGFIGYLKINVYLLFLLQVFTGYFFYLMLW